MAKTGTTLDLANLSSDIPSKIVAFWTSHISVFVNTTDMIVNSYTILYLYVEVTIC